MRRQLRLNGQRARKSSTTNGTKWSECPHADPERKACFFKLEPLANNLKKLREGEPKEPPKKKEMSRVRSTCLPLTFSFFWVSDVGGTSNLERGERAFANGESKDINASDNRKALGASLPKA